jgi:branched-chain amino acid aminotransferase
MTGMSKVADLAWCNGEIIHIEGVAPSIASISLHMGTGVFDGMMGYWVDGDRHLFRAEEHYKRWLASSAQMNMDIPWTVEQLIEATHAICRQLPVQTSYVRPLAYRGGPELWLTGAEGRPVDVTIFAVPTERMLGKSVRCTCVATERVSSLAMPVPWKVCGLYVNSYLARRSAERLGFDDGLMMDRHGNLAEASAANVFLINNGRLTTPALTGDVFPGITRNTIFDICRQAGIACMEGVVSRSDVEHTDGAFLCSTLMEIRPITQLGGRRLATLDMPVYNTIIDAFANLTAPL